MITADTITCAHTGFDKTVASDNAADTFQLILTNFRTAREMEN